MITRPIRALKSSAWAIYRHLIKRTSLGRKAALVSFYTVVEDRRKLIKDSLLKQQGRTVAFGPFAGSILSLESSWFDADVAAKLLGCYEQELHVYITRLLARSSEVIVNVGCAEGYYAVGLARLTQCPVYAIDIEPKALELCTAAAEENGVGQRVLVSSDSSPVALNNFLRGKKGLVVSDCEGGEVDLLLPELVPALTDCDLLIESHDFRIADATAVLQGRFAETHEIIIVQEAGRNPNVHQALMRLSSLDRWLAICEGRPETMSWLVCFARSRKEEPYAVKQNDSQYCN